MATMTRKDFTTIAGMLSDHAQAPTDYTEAEAAAWKACRDSMASALLSVCASSNKNFDVARFKAAAKMEG